MPKNWFFEGSEGPGVDEAFIPSPKPIWGFPIVFLDLPYKVVIVVVVDEKELGLESLFSPFHSSPRTEFCWASFSQISRDLNLRLSWNSISLMSLRISSHSISKLRSMNSIRRAFSVLDICSHVASSRSSSGWSSLGSWLGLEWFCGGQSPDSDSEDCCSSRLASASLSDEEWLWNWPWNESFWSNSNWKSARNEGLQSAFDNAWLPFIEFDSLSSIRDEHDSQERKREQSGSKIAKEMVKVKCVFIKVVVKRTSMGLDLWMVQRAVVLNDCKLDDLKKC